MIGKLIFKLPEEREEFKLAQNAGALACALEEFGTKLARRYKHAEPKSDEAFAEYEAIRQEFFDFLEAEGINEILY